MQNLCLKIWSLGFVNNAIIGIESNVNYCSSLLLILKCERACNWSERLEQEPFTYPNLSLVADHESWMYALL
jgi:hypothetical protein